MRSHRWAALVFVLFLITRDVCVLVVGVFVFPGHEHGWFRVWVGRDEVWVVCLLGFSLRVAHTCMWCL